MAIKQVSNIIEYNGINENRYQATYIADHQIDDAEAKNIIDKNYCKYPVIDSSYKLGGHKITIDYTVSRKK